MSYHEVYHKSFFSFKYIRFFPPLILIFLFWLLVLSSDSLVTTQSKPEGKTAIANSDNIVPPLIVPVFVYTGSPSATGQIVTTGQTNIVAVTSVVFTTSSSSSSKGHNVAAVDLFYGYSHGRHTVFLPYLYLLSLFQLHVYQQ